MEWILICTYQLVTEFHKVLFLALSYSLYILCNIIRKHSEMLGKAFWSVWRTFWCWQFLTGWGRWLSPINMILAKVSDCLWQFLFLPEVSVCYGIFSLPPSLSACWYMGSLRLNSFLYGLSFQVKCIEFTLLWTGPLNEVELNWVESKLWVSTSSLCHCPSLYFLLK